MSSGYVAAMVDTEMIAQPAMRRLARGTRFLYLEMLVWSRLMLTDGAIPKDMLGAITDEPEADAAAEQLRLAGLVDDAGDHWQITAFAETQYTADKVRHKRDMAKKRYANWQGRDPQTRLPKSKRVAGGPNVAGPDLNRKGGATVPHPAGAGTPRHRAPGREIDSDGGFHVVTRADIEASRLKAEERLAADKVAWSAAHPGQALPEDRVVHFWGQKPESKRT